ncbi:MAG: short-chain dehydrogenase [Porticoccaceae bacterium]|nr:short-chain dehydrogenase [Porticoccaceae bacterium]|tara:strand:- start:34 stop:774 length:741 start_codon:yes stop_codon:yes gene_type:complete
MGRLYKNCALVVGASGGIGSALVSAFLSDGEIGHVFAASANDVAQGNNTNTKLTWLPYQYNEPSIISVVDQLSELKVQVSHICICSGILHGENLRPEKRLEDLNSESLQILFHANSIVPILWIKALRGLCNSDQKCCIAVLSARVGSISDNRLGGWYGYRSSKAALNMLLKSASVEYARRNKNVKLISFHPGTTDTELSKPFQSAVRAEKLFTPDFVASKLLELMNSSDIDGELSFLDWQGETVEW